MKPTSIPSSSMVWARNCVCSPMLQKAGGSVGFKNAMRIRGLRLDTAKRACSVAIKSTLSQVPFQAWSVRDMCSRLASKWEFIRPFGYNFFPNLPHSTPLATQILLGVGRSRQRIAELRAARKVLPLKIRLSANDERHVWRTAVLQRLDQQRTKLFRLTRTGDLLRSRPCYMTFLTRTPLRLRPQVSG